MLRTIRMSASPIIVVAIAMVVAVSRPIAAQTPAALAEPLTETEPVSLRRAAAAAVERLHPASLLQGAVVQTSADAPWARVSALASGASVDVRMTDGRRVKGRVTSASDDTLAIQTSSGPISIPRAEIRQIRVPDAGRLLLYGALGIGGGLAAGWAACPHCPTSNEGPPSAKYILMGAAAGAGAAAIAAVVFPPHRTIYETP